MATTLLTEALGPAYKSYVLENQSNPEKIWHLLETTYGKFSNQQILILENKWANFRWNPSWSVDKFFQELKILTTHFSSAKKRKSSSDIFTKVLSLIPAEYEILKQIMMGWDQADLEKMREHLIQSEQAKGQTKDTGIKEIPKIGHTYTIGGKKYQLKQRQRNQQKQKDQKTDKQRDKTGKQERSEIQCWYCGIKGHSKSECKRRKEDFDKGEYRKHSKFAKMPPTFSHEKCKEKYCKLAGKAPKEKRGKSNVNIGLSNSEEDTSSQEERVKEKPKQNVKKAGKNLTVQFAKTRPLNTTPGQGFFFTISNPPNREKDIDEEEEQADEDEDGRSSPMIREKSQWKMKRHVQHSDDDGKDELQVTVPQPPQKRRRLYDTDEPSSSILSEDEESTQEESSEPLRLFGPSHQQATFVEGNTIVRPKQAAMFQTEDDHTAFFFGMGAVDDGDNSKWILDGGATHHLTTCRSECW
jgi:hypothetical protein